MICVYLLLLCSTFSWVFAMDQQESNIDTLIKDSVFYLHLTSYAYKNVSTLNLLPRIQKTVEQSYKSCIFRPLEEESVHFIHGMLVFLPYKTTIATLKTMVAPIPEITNVHLTKEIIQMVDEARGIVVAKKFEKTIDQLKKRL